MRSAGPLCSGGATGKTLGAGSLLEAGRGENALLDVTGLSTIAQSWR